MNSQPFTMPSYVLNGNMDNLVFPEYTHNENVHNAVIPSCSMVLQQTDAIRRNYSGCCHPTNCGSIANNRSGETRLFKSDAARFALGGSFGAPMPHNSNLAGIKLENLPNPTSIESLGCGPPPVWSTQYNPYPPHRAFSAIPATPVTAFWPPHCLDSLCYPQFPNVTLWPHLYLPSAPAAIDTRSGDPPCMAARSLFDSVFSEDSNSQLTSASRAEATVLSSSPNSSTDTASSPISVCVPSDEPRRVCSTVSVDQEEKGLTTPGDGGMQNQRSSLSIAKFARESNRFDGSVWDSAPSDVAINLSLTAVRETCSGERGNEDTQTVPLYDYLAHLNNDETKLDRNPGEANERPKLGGAHQCLECTKMFFSERALRVHMSVHQTAKAYQCGTCGSRFNRKFHLTRHTKQRGCEGTARSEFTCPFCSKVFTRKDNLQEHIKGHTGNMKPRRRQSCPIFGCNKSFQGRTQLEVHLNGHSGSRPFVCDRKDCGKTFRSKASLKKHLRIHNEENPHQCPQCDMRFTTRETLERHFVTHPVFSVINSYVCKKCGMAFVQVNAFENHMKEHSLDESFECALCDTKFKSAWKLEQHQKLMHETQASPGSACVEPQVILGDEESSSVHVPRTSPPSTVVALTEQSDNASKVHRLDGESSLLRSQLEGLVAEKPKPPLQTDRASAWKTAAEVLNENYVTKEKSDRMPITKCANTEKDREANGTTKVCDLQSRHSGHAQNPEGAKNPEEENESHTSETEGNIIELLKHLVDAKTLENFGWPRCSVDELLQIVLTKCGKRPLSDPKLPLSRRLRENLKSVFSFIVDDPLALENLYLRCSVEQVLKQVIELAKRKEENCAFQLPI